MTELKTLTDIMNSIPYEEVSRTRVADELRQEAIKWVKDIREKTPKEIIGIPNHISIWIKYFFNLTKEDLK
jgi:hypothetical protein